jgi:hypothetical protein
VISRHFIGRRRLYRFIKEGGEGAKVKQWVYNREQTRGLKGKPNPLFWNVDMKNREKKIPR